MGDFIKTPAPRVVYDSMTKLQKYTSFLFVLGLFSIISLGLGVLFEKTGERYYGYFIDALYPPLYHRQQSPQTHNNILIPVRHIELSRDPERYDDESDRKIITNSLSLKPKSIGLLLTDVWDVTDEPNDGYRNRTIKRTREKIIPLLNKARKAGVTIFHSPNGSPITKDIHVLDNEINLSWLAIFPRKVQTMYFYWLAKSMGVEVLLIAGFSTPLCIFERSIGVRALSRYEGIQYVLVRDATHTWEYSDFGEDVFTRNFISYLEHKYLKTTSVDEITNNVLVNLNE